MRFLAKYIIPVLCLFFVLTACSNRKPVNTAADNETITEAGTKSGTIPITEKNAEDGTIQTLDTEEQDSWQFENPEMSGGDNDVMSRAANLVLAAPVEGRFGSGSKWYKLDLPGANWIKVSFVGNGDITALLSLYNSEGILIARNSGRMSAEILIGVPAGQLFMEISRTGGQGDSGYSLNAVMEIPKNDNFSKESARFISTDITVQDSFLSGWEGITERWYRLEVPSNPQGVTIYTEGALNIKLSVYDNEDRLIAQDSQSGYVYNASVNISGQGRVFIKVEEYDRKTGEFRLTAQAAY